MKLSTSTLLPSQICTTIRVAARLRAISKDENAVGILHPTVSVATLDESSEHLGAGESTDQAYVAV